MMLKEILYVVLFIAIITQPFSLDLKLNNDVSAINTKVDKLAELVGEKYFSQKVCTNIIRERGYKSGFIINNTIILLEVNSSAKNCRDILYRIFRKTFEYKCDG